MCELWRRLSMLGRLARRGAWYGFGRFSGSWIWGLTHAYCRQCRGPKQRGFSPNCSRCGLRNIYRALFEEDSNGIDE